MLAATGCLALSFLFTWLSQISVLLLGFLANSLSVCGLGNFTGMRGDACVRVGIRHINT